MTSLLHVTTTLRWTILTLLISALGGWLASLLALPAPWLMGGSLAVAIAALSGMRVIIPDRLRDLIFVGTGMSMGASVARDSLALMAQWPITLCALAIELALIIALTGYLLRRLFGLDRGTAYMSSFPGHLSFVMSMAAAGVGDSRQIIIIQVVRILLLTVSVPLLSMVLPIGHYAAPAAAASAEWPVLVVIGIVCALTGLAFRALRIPAAFALGAMAASTTAKLSGFFDGGMPPLLLTVIFIAVGALIGSRFNGISRKEFRAAAIAGIGGTGLTVLIVSLVALVVTPLVHMPYGQVWLGLSPGALEGMGALGIALGFDTAFIAAHHVSRLLFLTFAIPLVTVWVKRGEKTGVSS